MNIKESVLKFYKVKTEEELERKIAQDCLKVPCIVCRKEYAIDKVTWICGDPVCKNCSKG